MENIFAFICQVVKKMAIPFMVAVIILNVFSYLGGADEIVKVTSLCGHDGITYHGIFEIFSLCLLIGIINTIFDAESFMKQTLYLYKNILRIAIIVVLTVLYVWLFKWFVNSLDAWVSFVITFGICIVVSIGINIYITHKKNLEYQELLIKYKEREH